MNWNGKYLVLVSLILFMLMACDNETSLYKKNIDYKTDSTLKIIPQPSEINFKEGIFLINKNTTITTFTSCSNEAEYLKQIIESSSKFVISINYSDTISFNNLNNTILLFNHHQVLEEESYQIDINSNNIKIIASANQGLMWGIQTLRQLFIDEFHQNLKRDYWVLPNLILNDSPKFKHRGLLLDCARHFFDKEVVKKYIDLMALYKMNVLHWHLTEDQGWRIEIEKYPKLTEIGAWRNIENGEKYGGFYTKEEIKEIVKYAQQRHIKVIPEIELPGHSQAAIAAYPHLSCNGTDISVANEWGVFKEIYCAGNDSVFIFLENILTEIIELFPSEYIHIGADEVPKYRWENCKKCQKRIKEEGLKNEHELQSYFITRIEKFLNKNGKKIIGWDEILEGGLSKNATVQSWRGMEGGVKAANLNHDVIMSPTSHCYFDYDLKSIDLEKVYNFNPIPKEIPLDKKKYVIGGECNMWTEHVPNKNALDQKVFPRLLAMSEVLWSYPENRNYESFYRKVQAHYQILKNLDVNYGLENLPATLSTEMEDNDRIMISLKPGNKDISLKYRWICDTCKAIDYAKFNHRIHLDQSGILSVQAYKTRVKYGNPLEQSFIFHEGLGKKINYLIDYNSSYTAGGKLGLVDGKIGSLDFRDGNWQGFWGDNIELVVDLGEEKYISSISTNFYQYSNSWIFQPINVNYEISVDGVNYKKLVEITNDPLNKEKKGKFIKTFERVFDLQNIKYIKLSATNLKTVPIWHEAAGSKSWLFIDEIVIK